MKSLMNKNTAIGFLIILYIVGYVCIGLEVMPAVVYLTPVNLLISIAVAMYFDDAEWKTHLGFAVPVFLLGFGIEVIGIQTGAIFGEYAYGDILGVKLWDTPLMIGVNWVLVCFSSGYFINSLLPQLSNIIKAVLAASLLVMLDVIIEPVAIDWGMWSWAIVEVPLQNYLAWWIIGFILMLIFFHFYQKSTNKVAAALLIMQVIFFGLLNL